MLPPIIKDFETKIGGISVSYELDLKDVAASLSKERFVPLVEGLKLLFRFHESS